MIRVRNSLIIYMPRKKYIVTRTETERKHLEKLTQTGKTAAYIITHARILHGRKSD
jgi:hypothetical protein